jgi:2-(1,2-epoxy-1,2-dihydrophenyl)acetyl-CoA isomerase
MDTTTTDGAATAQLVQRLYDALAALDLPALEELLDPGFHGVLAAGMPFGVGGEHHGAEAMRRNGWGAIGRYYVANAEPERFLPLVDGRMLVTGRYIGHGRDGGGPLDAPFAHIVTVSGGRITGLEQYTDTARWVEAAPPAS